MSGEQTFAQLKTGFNRKLFPGTLCTNSSKKWQKHITHLLHSIDLLRYSQIDYRLQSVYHCLQKDQSRKEYLRKLREHSVATAFASRVFPVPGGPYSKTPVTHTHTHLHQDGSLILKAVNQAVHSWEIKHINWNTTTGIYIAVTLFECQKHWVCKLSFLVFFLI